VSGAIERIDQVQTMTTAIRFQRPRALVVVSQNQHRIAEWVEQPSAHRGQNELCRWV